MTMAEKFKWQNIAKKKREALFAAIPKAWRLIKELPPTEELKDITGSFIEQYLSLKEIEITGQDVTVIVGKTTTGVWKAREVAEAFCHRAAVAHQMVKHILSIAHCMNSSHFLLP